MNEKYIRLGSNLKTVTEKTGCFKANKRWKCNNLSKNLQNVMLASTFCHIILIDLLIILLVWKRQPSRTKMSQRRSFVTLTLNPQKAKLLLK